MVRETYFCKFCDSEILPDYATGHIAKHFQKQEFVEQWIRKHFSDFYYKRNRSLEHYVDLQQDFGFTVWKIVNIRLQIDREIFINSGKKTRNWIALLLISKKIGPGKIVKRTGYSGID